MENPNDWTELPDMLSVAQAAKDGWKIQSCNGYPYRWEEWKGSYWSKTIAYRGQPKDSNDDN